MNPNAKVRQYKVELTIFGKEVALSANIVVDVEEEATDVLLEHDDPVDEEPDTHGKDLVPRCFGTLNRVVLHGIPIRKRPPDSYCDMCVGYPGMEREKATLQQLLDEKDEHLQQGEKGYRDWWWGEYESFEKAAARLQELTRLCQRRKQHTIWLATQRIAVSPIIPMHPSRVTPHTSLTRTVPTGPNSKEGTGANDSGDGVFGLWHDL